jgi:hypothetical protein
MFMLLAIAVGILVGLVAGGHLEGLAAFRLRWAWVAVAGLLVQVVLFSESGNELAGDAGPPVYVGSTLAVFLAVGRNLRIPGMPLVALGSLSNLVAISSNGGFMPASPEALRAAGLDGPGSHTNSIVLENPAFEPLTDIFAIPAGLPLANVFSVGDVLLGVGVVWVIVGAMRRREPAVGAATPVAAAEG